jgi:hypothetical protein
MELAPLCPTIEHVILMDHSENDRHAFTWQKAKKWRYESLLVAAGFLTLK